MAVYILKGLKKKSRAIHREITHPKDKLEIRTQKNVKKCKKTGKKVGRKPGRLFDFLVKRLKLKLKLSMCKFAWYRASIFTHITDEALVQRKPKT